VLQQLTYKLRVYLKTPCVSCYKYWSAESSVFKKSYVHRRFTLKHKCYLLKVGSCRFIPNTLSRSLFFYIALLLTVCPVRLEVILFMLKQSKQDPWQWFTQCISTQTFWKIADEKLSPLTSTGRSKRNEILLVYFRISGHYKRRWSLCSCYNSEMWKGTGPK
jgi:hypothetical protein